MTLDRTRPLFLRLLILAFMVLVPPVVLLTLDAMDEFARGLTPELDRKAETVGHDLASSIERALGYGIPLDKLEGVDAFFSPILESNREIRYLAVTDRDNRILFMNGADPTMLKPYFAVADFEGGGSPKSRIEGYINLALPLHAKGRTIGHMHVGLDHDYVRGRLMEIATDTGVVSLVSLLVAVEILLFVVTFNVIGPLRAVGTVMARVRKGDFTHGSGLSSEDEVGRFVRGFNAAIRRADAMFRRLEAYADEVKGAHFDKSVVERVAGIQERVRFLFRFSASGQPEMLHERQVTDIRLPLFLFVFSEEISRPFMPLYMQELYAPIPGLAPELVIALPIAVFMLFIAAASPWAAAIAARRGSRAVFLAGMVPAALGFLMSALAQSVYDFMLWRGLTAIGYALVTMSCQAYIAQAAHSQKRTQGLGVYVGAVLTASICGTGFGGVLAERVGYRVTFAIAAVLCLVAGLLIHRLMEARPGGTGSPSPGQGSLFRLLRNWRFSALILFAAIPAKMALTGFFFFLIPLTFIQIPDTDLGDIARHMMLYPIFVVLISPLSARLADRTGWKAGLVAVGGVLGGVSLVLPALGGGDSAQWILVSIVLLGISHGLSASPQLAMIPDICWTECRALGQTHVLAFVRTAERIGSIAGPLMAAALIPIFGIAGAGVVLGWVVLGLSAVFALLSFRYGSGPHIEAEVAE